jgi:hypothetical protein
MKLLKYIIPAVVGVCSFSCDETLTEINKDPNGATTANPAATFVSGSAYYGIAIDAYVNELDALFAQYVAGGPGVALIDDERYFVQNTDYNAEWSMLYNQSLSDLKYTIDNGNEAQAAIADILSCHVWQVVVDHYGSVPYFEALQGAEGILLPAYDEPKAIYDDLIARVKASAVVLAETDEVLGDEDIFFGGDAESWIRFANSLELKLLMRQSITNAAEVGPKVIELITNGMFIEDESQIVAIPFSGSDGLNYNPSFARREAGVGQFYVASQTIVDEMTQLEDPRLAVLFDEAANFAGQIKGLKQGNIEDVVAPSKDDYSFPSAVAYAEDNDVILMSHWEVYFLRAEAAMRFGTADDEKAMFDAAVTAHFDYVGATGAATYLTESANYNPGATAAQKSAMIGIQKWISMLGLQEFEGWTETRRFDTADNHVFYTDIFVTPTRSTLGAGVFPTLRLYPQTETSYNPNAPTNRAITDKVFWDN